MKEEVDGKVFVSRMSQGAVFDVYLFRYFHLFSILTCRFSKQFDH